MGLAVPFRSAICGGGGGAWLKGLVNSNEIVSLIICIGQISFLQNLENSKDRQRRQAQGPPTHTLESPSFSEPPDKG
jgi:hypothetical protein